jgi:predicted AAA+ superfamily ATPase
LFAEPAAAVERAVAQIAACATRSGENRGEYADRVLAGGFPRALRASNAAARQRWFGGYIRQTVARDVPALEDIRRPDALRRLLGLLAVRTGQVLNVAALADAAGVAPTTAAAYISVLKSAFVVDELLPWTSVAIDRSFRKPKCHILDSGVAAHLLRLNRDKIASRTAAGLTAFGQLLESFVVAELLKEASWLDSPVSTGYWRTYEGDEVDLIIEGADGTVLAFEVKAAQRLRPDDFKGLRALKAKAAGEFAAGVALHTGTRAGRVEDRIFTLPIDALWSGNPGGQ